LNFKEEQKVEVEKWDEEVHDEHNIIVILYSFSSLTTQKQIKSINIIQERDKWKNDLC
jgi:hypothetical protein